MTPEVKKRIEQIQQGIVPEGYVKDKDGIYPRDWASKKIGQWLKLAERPIVLQDEEEYQLVTVRRGFGGVDSRGSFLGKNVLVKNYFIVKTGDFIISKRQIAHGACGIVPPELDGAVVSNEYNVFLPQDGTNIQMFNLMMQLLHYKRLFYLMSDGVHIEKLLFKTQDWMKRKLAMPLLKEQKKIAEILATQDKAIELQGRKIEELKRFKQGCLEKMFPRKGQKVPEKRFPGFTDDWEERKLNAVVSRESATKISSAKFPSVEYEDVISEEGHLNKDIYQKEPGKNGIAFDGSQVLYGKLRPYLHNWLNPDFKGVAVGDWWVMKPIDADKNFLYRLIQTPRFDNVSNQSSGSKMPRADWNLVSNTEFMIPYSKVEQHKIGEYFSSLDHLITLHQRKLEEMKRQKKALMQLLLTGIVRI